MKIEIFQKIQIDIRATCDMAFMKFPPTPVILNYVILAWVQVPRPDSAKYVLF